MKAVYQAVGLVLDNDITVLLEGESGTGKDLVANLIHDHSKRKNKPLVTVNCGAIPKELVESELFGHEKGAFTGASEKRIGKFELAQEGTLFLDEISELELPLQVKLLRAIQNREIERVGGSEPIKINVRIIAATNQDLKQRVETGKFRLDLYYRLHVFPISIPPLRDRKTDIIPLASYFIEKYAVQFGIETPALTSDAKDYLLNQKWEGNVRELENVIQRSVVISQGNPITSMTLQLKPGKAEPSLSIAPAPQKMLPEGNQVVPLDTLEKQAIELALKLKKGNVRQTARALGISRTTFYNKAKKYHIPFQEERA